MVSVLKLEIGCALNCKSAAEWRMPIYTEAELIVDNMSSVDDNTGEVAGLAI